MGKKSHFLGITLLALIILFAFALRVYRLDAKSLWSDEGLSMYRAHKDLPFILSNKIIIQGVVTQDLQPPLYFILLHFLIEFAGDSEFAAKFLSVIFSVLTVPLLYTVGKKLFSPQVGLFAAFLGATSPLYLWYSQELRMYTMLVFLGLLSVYTLLKVMEGNDSAKASETSKWAWRCGYVLTTVAMLYTHYSSFFMLLFEFIVFLIFAITRRRVWSVILLLVAALSALPLVPLALHRMQLGPEPLYRFVPLPVILRDLLNSFSLGLSVSLRRVFWLDMIFLAVFVVGILMSEEGQPKLSFKKSLPLLGYLFVPILALYIASHIKPLYMGARHLIIISPAYYLILAAGLVSLKRLWQPVLAICLVIFLAGFAYSTHNYFFDERYIKDDLRSMFSYVERHSQPGDIVALSDAVICHVFDYYHRGSLPWTSLPRYGTPFTPATIDEMQKLRDEYERIWFAYGPSGAYYEPTATLAKEWLDDNLFKADNRVFHGYGMKVAVACYLSQSPVLDHPPILREKLEAKLADKFALLGYELPPTPIAAGEMLHMDLYWQAWAEVDEDYRISAWLVDDEGHVWGHGDSEPFNSLHPTSSWEMGKILRETHELFIQWGTPPGSYRLEVEMYSPQSGRPLEVLDDEGIPQGTRISLGTIDVTKPTHPPSPRELPIQHRHLFDMDGQIAVVGYDSADEEAGPGDALHLSLYYLAKRKPEDDYRLSLQLVDEEGKVWVEEAFSPGGDGYPTTQWNEGEVVKGQYQLIVPADAPAGQYNLRGTIYAAATGELLPVRHFWLFRQKLFDLASVRIVEKERRFEMPSIQHPLSANLGDSVSFLGYDLKEKTLMPGGTLHLTLYWRCQRQMETSYKVFTHLLDEESRIWGQRDSIPAEGARPTTGWIENEVIADRYEILVKPEAPEGEYVLEIGMYDEVTGDRLLAFDEQGDRMPDDRILLHKVRVER